MNENKKNKYLLIALIITVTLMFFLVFSFVRDILRLYTNGVFIRPTSVHNFYRMARKPVTLSDVNFISGWMTFSYVNKVFNLPPDYLKNTLSLIDATYPRVTISKIATVHKISLNTYIGIVKSAVSTYLVQNTSPK